ncbi:DUF6105 family protein [Aureimonas sp. AU12]|uniref:DUF6105 family protein n=1 Tax=Aureimonas sp. AU12 TaxID=1638161 RepID=UPI000784BF12|nr:DUF6105 family protein [Aureimonas sp. AU12]
MRWFLGLWFVPITFLVLWFALAANDINLGTFFFSRAMYDLVFTMYGNVLGIPPADLPPMVARALMLDSAIVLALYVFRRRKPITAWVRSRYERSGSLARRTESLSSAP